MSKCISRNGEYGEHTPPDADWCEWCGAFNEEAVEAERDRLRAQVAAVRALADEWERALSDTLRVEIDELRAALDPDGGA